MAEKKEVIVQDKISTLYSTLVKAKQEKLQFMEKIRKYTNPRRKDVLRRYSEDAQVFDSETLADNTAGVSMRKFTTESLKDILNLSEAWFTLIKKLHKITDERTNEEFKAWAILNQEILKIFIEESDYYIALKDDKKFYDNYGFSGITFGHKDGKMMIKVENPFMLYRVVSDGMTVGCMWERTYKADQMLNDFGWKDPSFEQSGDDSATSSLEYTVVHAIVPNNETYIKNPLKNKKGYVQLFVLKDEGRMPSETAKRESSLRESYERQGGLNGQEIGERKHFAILPTVIAVDSKFEEYGDGEGEWVLLPATNCNRFNKNILSSSTIKARPPMEGPQEFFLENSYIEPGRVYPRNPTMLGGQDGIKFIEFKDKLNEQVAVLESERDQVRETLPTITSPPKKQRQSQYEIEKQELANMSTLFAYKLPYLKTGVAEHLKRMFYIARDLKVLTDLPKGIEWEDVEPSIGSLIEVEKQKIKGQKYVVTASMIQPYIANFLEGWDNFNKDNILRNIAVSQGTGGDLNSIDIRTQIREERRKQEQRIEQQQQAMMQAELNKLGATSGKEGAQQAKATAEAENIAQGG